MNEDRSNEDLGSLDWDNMSPEEFGKMLMEAVEEEAASGMWDQPEPSISQEEPKPTPTKSSTPTS